jgi:ZIP family zinc transporter
LVEVLKNFHTVTQAFLATCFTCALYALGAATVFMVREVSRETLDWMLGFAAGVMIAASYWSLIAPAIEMSEGRLVKP